MALRCSLPARLGYMRDRECLRGEIEEFRKSKVSENQAVGSSMTTSAFVGIDRRPCSPLLGVFRLLRVFVPRIVFRADVFKAKDRASAGTDGGLYGSPTLK
jgi:hypothetical protein